MTRLSKVPLQDWDSDLRALTQADGATPLEQGMTRVLAHSPEVAKAVVRFGGALFQSTRLPRRLIELVRLRIAFHNQCRSCMAIRYQSAIDDGLTEGMVCSLEKPLDAPDLSDAEKAAVAYADISSTDHFSIDDRTFSNLRRFFSEAEIVELNIPTGVPLLYELDAKLAPLSSRYLGDPVAIAAAAEAVTPGLAGMPWVARPEPAWASRPSTWPW